MTDQEAFDTVVRHLLTQKAKALGKDRAPRAPSCVYRAVDGKKCAVGVLIPDDQYQASFEGLSARELYYKVRAFRELNAVLLIELQSVHDSNDVADWPEALRTLANTFELDPSVLKEFPNAVR